MPSVPLLQNGTRHASSSGTDALYINYRNETFLKKALVENDFEVTDVFRKSYPGKQEMVSTHLILLAQKKN